MFLFSFILARRSREVQSLYKMYEDEEKSDKKEILERLVGENLKVQDLLYRFNIIMSWKVTADDIYHHSAVVRVQRVLIKQFDIVPIVIRINLNSQ